MILFSLNLKEELTYPQHLKGKKTGKENINCALSSRLSPFMLLARFLKLKKRIAKAKLCLLGTLQKIKLDQDFAIIWPQSWPFTC